MAKTILENTREHDITLNATNNDGELVQVTVPAARQSDNDKNVLVNGRVEVDDAFVGAAKKSAVVKHYFSDGWLVTKTVKNEKGSADPGKEGNKE